MMAEWIKHLIYLRCLRGYRSILTLRLYPEVRFPECTNPDMIIIPIGIIIITIFRLFPLIPTQY